MDEEEYSDYLADMMMKIKAEDEEERRKGKKAKVMHSWYQEHKDEHKERTTSRRKEIMMKISDDRKVPDHVFCELCGRELLILEQKTGECNVCRLNARVDILREDVNKALSWIRNWRELHGN